MEIGGIDSLARACVSVGGFALYWFGELL